MKGLCRLPKFVKALINFGSPRANKKPLPKEGVLGTTLKGNFILSNTKIP